MRVTALFYDTPQARAPMLAQLRAGLAAIGWQEGREIVLEERYAHASDARMDELAREAAAQRPDALVTAGILPTAAAHRATREIPIVMVGVGDPVGRGLIASFDRPGGNVTGSSDQAADAAAQRLRLIRELVAGPRVGVAGAARIMNTSDWEAAAAALGCVIHVVDTPSGQPIEQSLRAGPLQHLDALFVVPSPISFAARAAIARLALEQRLPVVFGWREFMDVPAPAGCGPNLTRLYAGVAPLLARIRAGERPADIPSVRPVFERWLRPAAWEALGRAPFAPTLLTQVEEVIHG